MAKDGRTGGLVDGWRRDSLQVAGVLVRKYPRIRDDEEQCCLFRMHSSASWPIHLLSPAKLLGKHSDCFSFSKQTKEQMDVGND